ncbi:MAG: amidohydrolase [bacterium]
MIDALASGLDEELIDVRRRLHAFPELSYREFVTTATLIERLEVAGLAPQRLAIGTGLVCDIPGTSPGPLVVLRADIDALATDDLSESEYRSHHDGVSHACGHDAHAAIVLGAGLVLQALAQTDGWPGTVRLVFEPAEEAVPGGAVAVIEEGWIAGAAYVLGLHCDPKTDVGRIGLRRGRLTASADAVRIVVTGPGGHTARPHLTVDLIRVLAGLAVALPDEVRRRLGDADAPGHDMPGNDVVMVFGAIEAGDASNVIPAMGEMRCVLRIADPDAWGRGEEAVRAAVADLLRDSGAGFEVHYERGAPPVVNDPSAIDVLAEAAQAVVGSEGVVEAPTSMGADTFSWYGAHARAGYARLGTHSGDRRLDLHASTFDIDERAIGIGVRLLSTAALLALGAPGRGTPGPAAV